MTTMLRQPRCFSRSRHPYVRTWIVPSLTFASTDWATAAYSSLLPPLVTTSVAVASVVTFPSTVRTTIHSPGVKP